MKRFLYITALVLCCQKLTAQYYTINIDYKTAAAMVSAYGAETAAEAYYNNQVQDVLEYYTAAEIAAAGIFSAKYLDRKALTDLGIWASSEENYYYRRIYNLVSAKIMPKIWRVSGMMLRSPQTAMYWGAYVLKICDETKSLCMQFESVVTNGRLSFSDIAFLELCPQAKAIFKLSELGDVDWRQVLDDFGDISDHFTKENLKEDIENLYSSAAGIASAGSENIYGELSRESKVNEYMQGRKATVANIVINGYNLYKDYERDAPGTLLGLVGGTDSVAALFSLSSYNLTNWIDDYAREGLGQYYTQRWYIEKRDAGSEVICDYHPSSDYSSIRYGGEWVRVPYGQSGAEIELQILRNSESYAGWSNEKVQQMNRQYTGMTFSISYNRHSYALNYGGDTRMMAYAYSIKVTRTWNNTETIYEEVFNSYTMDLATFQAQLNARLAELNDNEEGIVYQIGCDEKHYYQTTDAQKLKGAETAIISVTCHEGVTLIEGTTQYKCKKCGGSVNSHTKECVMKTSLDGDDNPVDTSELDEYEAQYAQEEQDLLSQIGTLEDEKEELVRQIADTANTVEQVAQYRTRLNAVERELSRLNTKLDEVHTKQKELEQARQEASSGEAVQTDDYYRIPAIMQDCKTAFQLTWQGNGYWSGNSYIRKAKAPNINGVLTFKADVSIARKPKYFLGIRIHRAIVKISWKLTAEYTDTQVVDIVELDPGASDADKAREVNQHISDVAKQYPSCTVSTEYIKNDPAELDDTDDTYHLLWSSDRLEIARQVDSRLTKIYADLVSLEKMMHYKLGIIDVLKAIAPRINDEQGRRFTLAEQARRRWLRHAADTGHSTSYNGKYDEEDEEDGNQ